MHAVTIGIDLPSDFPVSVYNDTHSKVGPLQPRFVDEFRHYAGAWNAVAFRYRAAAEADETFRQATSQPSSALQRYAQEVALFEFFTNAVAIFDSLAYGLYAIGAIVDQRSFPLTPGVLRSIQLQNTGALLSKHFAQDPIGNVMLGVANESMSIELREVRNALSHRASSTRTLELSVPPGKVTRETWKIDHLQLKSGIQSLDIDTDTTARYRRSMATQLTSILSAARSFVHGHL